MRLRRRHSVFAETGESAALRGVQPSALAYLVSMAMRRLRKVLVLIASTDKEAERFAEMIDFFSGGDLYGGRSGNQPASPQNRRGQQGGQPLARGIWLLPSRAGHKARALGKAETTAKRIEALYALRAGSSARVVVTSARALMERLIPPEVPGGQYGVPTGRGDSGDRRAGAQAVPARFFPCSAGGGLRRLESSGRRARRLCPLYRRPLRLEFFGDHLESIRLFHPATQRSLGLLEDAIILPANEIILDDEAKLRAQDAVYQDVRKGLLAPSAGNIWLDRIAEGYHSEAFEPVFSVFFGKTASLWSTSTGTPFWSGGRGQCAPGNEGALEQNFGRLRPGFGR